jgi:hypothetical protein
MVEEEWMQEVPPIVRITEGKHKFTITGKITTGTNRWGKKVLIVPTDQGILMVGSYTVMRALREYAEGHSNYQGAKLSFEVTGEGRDRRYKNVKVTER